MPLLYRSNDFQKAPWKSSCQWACQWPSVQPLSSPQLKFTSCDNQALVRCIPIAAIAVHLNLKIIKIGQSSHKMYSNNIVNFQESTTILNAWTKKVWKLIEGTTYLNGINNKLFCEKYRYEYTIKIHWLSYSVVRAKVPINYSVSSMKNTSDNINVTKKSIMCH